MPNVDLQHQAAVIAAQKKFERLAERAKRAHKHPNDFALALAIEDAIESVKFIPAEMDKFERLIQEAPPEDKEYLQWQAWIFEQQLLRASEEATRRKDYLRSIDTAHKIKREKELVSENTIHWFDTWAWTADPRSDSPLFTVPFSLFPFQKEGIEWLERLIFEIRSDGLIDKSRDMGVSWMTVAFAAKHWNSATRQTPFHALFGSRKEEFVDQLGNLSTLFEKIRFVIRHQPSFLLPDDFDVEKGMGFLRIVNPQTGSTLIGESSNPNFGRGGRYTVIFFDEHAAFPDGGYQAWTAAGQSSRSKISISTPQGSLNKQAELRKGGKIQMRHYHWKLHPWKTEAWYKGQAKSMSAVEIAQELDINYDASQPGRVFPNYQETHHVITWEEFAKVYPQAKVHDQSGKFLRYRIPLDWSVGRAHDWGSTEKHPAIVLWLAVAKEGTPYSGTVFVYREYQGPTGAIPTDIADAIKEAEKPDNEGHYSRLALSIMSHEAKSERDTYSREHQLQFSSWDTDTNHGIAQVKDFLKLIETDKPHPFAILPGNVPDGVYLNGRPRLMFIVDNDEGKLLYNESLGSFERIGPVSHKGLIRLRFEMPMYHYPEEEEGKAVQKMRPFKLFDDAIDCLRCAAGMWFPAIKPESLKEKLNRMMPDEMKMESILKLPPHEQAAAMHAREFKIHSLQASIPRAMNWRSKAKLKRRARAR
jgi:hypothetical protein